MGISQCFKNWIVCPVQSIGSKIGDELDWINLLKLLVGQNQSKPEKIGLNRPKSFEPKNRSRFCKTVRFKKIHQIDLLFF